MYDRDNYEADANTNNNNNRNSNKNMYYIDLVKKLSCNAIFLITSLLL